MMCKHYVLIAFRCKKYAAQLRQFSLYENKEKYSLKVKICDGHDAAIPPYAYTALPV